MMNKKSLSESEICEQYIVPAMRKAGWDEENQIVGQYPLRAGRVVVQGRKGRRDESTVLRADYVLFYKPHIPLAVVEAKHNGRSIGAGMQQALRYAALLDVPFVFSSNGDGFSFRDATLATGVLEHNIRLDEFPSPATLWARLCAWKGWTAETQRIAALDYAPSRTPRYYQINAINRTVEAIAGGQKRVLLVMATGTGKTYTAFQIIWRLWKSGVKKRILFLADRNVLIDQTMTNDFRPFKGAMVKLSSSAQGIEQIDGGRVVNKSYEIYLSLYQAVTGTEERANIYPQFSPDFFDLIVVDECHRGSAADDSAWREILHYFGNATQIGLTATPTETKDISTTDYFGEPLITYSLKQGIEDGFLAPYKVVRVDLDKDVFGWQPPAGMVDDAGQVIENRVYTGADMNRRLVLLERDKVVAQRITDYLKATDRMAKTIVFCEDINHAERMRQALSNANADLCATQPNYVVQITGDNPDGLRELDNFTDTEKPYPVIATTSRLLSTGVDVPTCKLIVLDQNIQSMTLFKQIIGRGTRLREDLGKTWFTVLDFKRATTLFEDKEFNGEPVQIYEPQGDDPIAPPDDEMPPPPSEPFYRARYIVGKGVSVSIARELEQYLNADGQLTSESLRDYTRSALRKRFASLDAFLQTWSGSERKSALIEELKQHGVLLDELMDDLATAGLTNLDPFDALRYVAWNVTPLTRRERARRVKQGNIFIEYGTVARKVLDTLIEQYADTGIVAIEDDSILKLQPFRVLGGSVELVCSFGGRPQYMAAIQTLERALYRM